jgi:hypothetical protein
MKKPKTLRVFLLEGEPTGVKTVELGNWTGKAYFIPRNKLQEAITDNYTKQELGSQRVYFLIGEAEDGERRVYVGEAENFIDRIAHHHRNKDFWNLAVCFVSKDENLTKAHVKYLESLLAQKIQAAGRVQVENSTNPNPSGLPRPDIAEMNEFLDNIELILSTLGLTFLQKLEDPHNEIFYCTGPNAEAKGTLTDEGFVVYKGSKIRKEEVDSINPGLSKLRKKAINTEQLKDKGQYYLLVEDKVFSSPSYAAGFATGRNENGWRAWKTKQGKTLDEVKRI